MANRMIHQETWYKEAVSLDKRFQYLLELAKHNAISPEDFTRQMVRLYHSPDSFEDIFKELGYGLLDPIPSLSPSLKDTFTMTSIWLGVHKNWIEEAKRLDAELDTILAPYSHSEPYFSIRVAIDNLARAEKGRVVPALPVERFPNHSSGGSTREWVEYSSEYDFNQRVKNVLEDAQKALDSLQSSQG